MTAGTDYHPLFHHHNWHHDQPDKGHFTLSAFDQLFIRSIGTDGRRSEYHNEVLIDGKGQVTTVLNTDHSKGWQGQNRGVITEFTSSPRFDFVDCDATDSYGALHWGIGLSNEVTYTRDDAGQNEVSEFNPVDHAHRYVSFSRASDGVPPYLVMADDIKKDANPHNYTWRVFTSKAKFTISGNEFHLKDNAGSQILLDVYYACASPITTSVIQLPQMQMAQVPIFDPYSACGTAWNTICDNPLAVDAVTTTNVVNPYFHVVLLPRKAGDLVPTYVTTTTSTGSIITVSWPAPSNYVDYSIFNTSGLDFVTDAKLSRVRLAPGSVISSFQMAQGTVLSKNGTELVNLYGCPGTVTRAGSRVDIAGATVGDSSASTPRVQPP